MSRKLSILKRPSINTVPSGDFCPVIPGGKRKCNDSSDEILTVHCSNCKTLNDGFVDLDNGGSNSSACDYNYVGYTLEITDKVRIVPLSNGTKEDADTISSLTKTSKEDINTESNTPIKKKTPKRVQFWGYERE